MFQQLEKYELVALEDRMTRSRYRQRSLPPKYWSEGVWDDVMDVMVDVMTELRKRAGYDYY